MTFAISKRYLLRGCVRDSTSRSILFSQDKVDIRIDFFIDLIPSLLSEPINVDIIDNPTTLESTPYPHLIIKKKKNRWRMRISNIHARPIQDSIYSRRPDLDCPSLHFLFLVLQVNIFNMYILSVSFNPDSLIPLISHFLLQFGPF